MRQKKTKLFSDDGRAEWLSTTWADTEQIVECVISNVKRIGKNSPQKSTVEFIIDDGQRKLPCLRRCLPTRMLYLTTHQIGLFPSTGTPQFCRGRVGWKRPVRNGVKYNADQEKRAIAVREYQRVVVIAESCQLDDVEFVFAWSGVKQKKFVFIRRICRNCRNS